MKHIQTLRRATTENWFFRIFGTDYSICVDFTEKLAGVPIQAQLRAHFELRTKNPKTKGFRKILWEADGYYARLNGKNFSVMEKQVRLLNGMGIQAGDCFWMKVELS